MALTRTSAYGGIGIGTVTGTSYQFLCETGAYAVALFPMSAMALQALCPSRTDATRTTAVPAMLRTEEANERTRISSAPRVQNVQPKQPERVRENPTTRPHRLYDPECDCGCS